MKEIKKRFPATIDLQQSTFLNDKKVDGELYAYFQSISFPEGELTIVKKESLPTKKEMCGKLGFKSVKTFNSHLEYLIEKGYIVEELEKYILPNVEDFYALIPLKTIQFLNDTLQTNVIKTYIYLGQKRKFKTNYEFTIKELATNIGVKVEHNSRAYETINNILQCLKILGLINYITVPVGNTESKKILTYFSEKVEENKKEKNHT